MGVSEVPSSVSQTEDHWCGTAEAEAPPFCAEGAEAFTHGFLALSLLERVTLPSSPRTIV